MTLDTLRQGVGSWWDSVAEGWERVRRSASTALTRFRPGEKTSLPASADIDDAMYLPSQSWSLLGGDVFEDEQRIVVRLEAPGLEKPDFDIEVLGDSLVVRGEKRFDSERTEGRWRVVQCAYGSFRRTIPLPAAVKSDAARASYRNGVLRIELPKQQVQQPTRRLITVQ